MKVRYIDLLNGRVLNPGDKLDNIHGFRGYSVESADCGFHLYNHDGPDDAILQHLGKELRFPIIKSREAFTYYIHKLYQASPYKVGDLVRVKILGNPDAYPVGISHEMMNLSGKYAKILNIKFVMNRLYLENNDIKGDPHIVRLDFGKDSSNLHTWHSSMFERADEAEARKELLHMSGGIIEQLEIDPIPFSISPGYLQAMVERVPREGSEDKDEVEVEVEVTPIKHSISTLKITL